MGVGVGVSVSVSVSVSVDVGVGVGARPLCPARQHHHVWCVMVRDEFI